MHLGGTVEDRCPSSVKLLPPNDCRNALYSAKCETKEFKKEVPVFTFRASGSAPLKSKIIHACSNDASNRKFTGSQREWRVNGWDNIKDRSTLGEKLGGNVVVPRGGKPLENGSQVAVWIFRIFCFASSVHDNSIRIWFLVFSFSYWVLPTKRMKEM